MSPPSLVCLDLSAHGDPVDRRFARCALSGHQKALLGGWVREGPTVCLPRRGTPLDEALATRASLDAAASAAERTRAGIPAAPEIAALRWVERYRASSLAHHHRRYDAGWHDPTRLWPATYDRFDTARLPRGVRAALENPNPALLQPVQIRTVARALWRRGWHPRSVAGLIRSKYERDHGWGRYWYAYDAAQRADFYVWAGATT